jgi:hypothetical protein
MQVVNSVVLKGYPIEINLRAAPFDHAIKKKRNLTYAVTYKLITGTAITLCCELVATW